MAELLMKDPFARTTAKRAHQTAQETRAIVAELERKYLNTYDHRPTMFHGLCALCGNPCRHPERYCQTHQWAA